MTHNFKIHVAYIFHSNAENYGWVWWKYSSTLFIF